MIIVISSSMADVQEAQQVEKIGFNRTTGFLSIVKVVTMKFGSQVIPNPD